MLNVWPKRLVYWVTSSVRTVGLPGQNRNVVGQPAPVLTSAAFRRTTLVASGAAVHESGRHDEPSVRPPTDHTAFGA